MGDGRLVDVADTTLSFAEEQTEHVATLLDCLDRNV
jgi:hypothetical protein